MLNVVCYQPRPTKNTHELCFADAPAKCLYHEDKRW